MPRLSALIAWCASLGLLTAASSAQPPVRQAGPAAAAEQGTPSATAGARQRPRTLRPGADDPQVPAPLIFREVWNSLPNAEPMTQEHLSNQDMRLHLYGDTAHIRKSAHPTENYTYTGETLTNWGLTLESPSSYWDLTGKGKVMLKTRNSGYRTLRIMLKTADGKWFVSEEGSPDSSVWIEREYILADLTWRNLMMTDTPTNATNVRQPMPGRQPIMPTTRAQPDLSRVAEIGFTDLMSGGWIPSTSRVNAWAVYGRKIPRN